MVRLKWRERESQREGDGAQQHLPSGVGVEGSPFLWENKTFKVTKLAYSTVSNFCRANVLNFFSIFMGLIFVDGLRYKPQSPRFCILNFRSSI